MDQELDLPIRTVVVCRNERSGSFNLIRYAGREGFGGSFVTGPLLPVPENVMINSGLRLVMDSLKSYRIWPTRTKVESEIGAMNPQKLSKFVRDHKFTVVLQRKAGCIAIAAEHRVGRGWRGITQYLHEEKEFKLPLSQDQFLHHLLLAFELAT